MSEAWDAVSRVWLVIATWFALRRPPRPPRLARIREPMRYVRAAMIAAGQPGGGQVALAIVMLPRRRRAEAMIAFVACRTLHAIDALSSAVDARRRIRSAVAYFVGEASGPTRLDTRGPRNFDAVLAARMALVRGALDELPGDAARRCCDIIERIGDSLIRARDDGKRHADHARGEAVVYAIRLAAPVVRPPIAACKSAGRVITLGRELAAAPSTQLRDAALDRAMPALTFVPRLLRWLPASIGPGTRAAMVMLASTLYPFARAALAPVSPRRLRHPLWAALTAACSRRAYLLTTIAIEEVLHEARAGLVSRHDGHALGSAVTSPSGARRSDATLIALALEMVQVAPDVSDDAPTEPRNLVARAAHTTSSSP